MKKIKIVLALIAAMAAVAMAACGGSDKDKNTITVEGGAASHTSAAPGTEITLTVDNSKTPIGKVFHHWESPDVEIAGDTFVMPDKNVTVRASYDGSYGLTVEGGTAKADAEYNEVVKLNVDMSAIPAGKEFLQWEAVGDSNVRIDSHYLTMPAKEITVRAVYRDIPDPAKSYRLTYITNVEKDSLMRHVFVQPNELPVRPMDVEMREHHVLGWYRDESYNVPFTFDNPIALGSAGSASDITVTLYAKWSITVYESGDFLYGVDKDTDEAVITGLTAAGQEKAALSVPAELDGRKVTMIGAYSFKNSEKLESVTIPDGVTLIGDNAFYNCKKLANVVLPESLIELGHYAFKGTALREARLPDGLKIMRDGVFSHCYYLTGISVPDGITRIEEHTFEYCVSMYEAEIGTGVTAISAQAFYGSALLAIDIPANVKSVGESAFAKCGLLRVAAVSAAEYIGSNAFNTYVPSDFFSEYGFLRPLYEELEEGADEPELEYIPVKLVLKGAPPAALGMYIVSYDSTVYQGDGTAGGALSEYTAQLEPLDAFSLDDVDFDTGFDIDLNFSV